MNQHLFRLYILAFALLLCSCNGNDPVVAEAFNAKLYLSQVAAQIPDDSSPEDSTAFAEMLINHWIHQQLVLHEANKTLSLKDKHFAKEIEEYKQSLLINAYYEKITSDTNQFFVSDEELNAFLNKYADRYTVNREIIKINYVKTSKNSKVIAPLKELLFDEDRRITEKNQIESICSDSIEYFLEDNTWLYLDDIQNEFPIQIMNKESILTEDKYIETEDGDNHYLIVFLDYKSKRTLNETTEEINAARAMLLQQKKQAYIQQHLDDLYKQAVNKGSISLSHQ